MRRSLPAGLTVLSVLAALLAGCAAVPRSTLQQLRLLATPASEVTPTAAEVAANPYYQLEASSSAGSAVLVLGNIDAGRQAWYSATREILFLRHGVLVKTWRMRPDIIATRLPEDSPFRTGLQHLRGPVTTWRELDLPDYRYGVRVSSRLVPAGMQRVEILGTPHDLLRIDEHLEARAAGFEADNRYWVDPADGFVWKSRQTIPGGLTLTLTELRPYRGAAK